MNINEVFQYYENNKIIGRVPENEICKTLTKFHYLAHQSVVREEKDKNKSCF